MTENPPNSHARQRIGQPAGQKIDIGILEPVRHGDHAGTHVRIHPRLADEFVLGAADDYRLAILHTGRGRPLTGELIHKRRWSEPPSPEPLNTISTPEDIGNLALFLASEASRTITGQSINCDAGEVMIG